MIYDPFFLHLDTWPAWAALDQPVPPEPPRDEKGVEKVAREEALANAAARMRT